LPADGISGEQGGGHANVRLTIALRTKVEIDQSRGGRGAARSSATLNGEKKTTATGEYFAC
jgi:hypothetical protein